MPNIEFSRPETNHLAQAIDSSISGIAQDAFSMELSRNNERDVVRLALPSALLTEGNASSALKQLVPSNPQEEFLLTLVRTNGQDLNILYQVKIDILPQMPRDPARKIELTVGLDGTVSGDKQVEKEFVRIIEYEKYQRRLREILISKGTSGNTLRKAEQALLLAEIHLRGMMRADDVTPALDHAFESARILIEECGVHSRELVPAALDHDILEDSPLFRREDDETHSQWIARVESELSKLIGEDAAKLVVKVTRPKPDNVQIFSRAHADYLYRKNIQGDVKATLIKMSDRLHNLRTLAALSPDRQVNIIIETINYFPMFEVVLQNEQYSVEAAYLLNEMWKVIAVTAPRYNIPVETPHFYNPEVERLLALKKEGKLPEPEIQA